MKKIIAVIFAATLALAGCNSTPVSPTSPTTPTVKDIQSVVTTACGFLPAVSTVANIISASPTVLTATQIANIICKAVSTKGVHRNGVYAPKATVVGNKVILINGEFVK